MKWLLLDWLKSLKDRVQPQPKQEWSEEDEKMFNSIVVHLNATCGGFPEDEKWANKFLDWLKSLKPQKQWKPSKKQMKDLAFVADQNKGNMVGKTMISLYKDLKKLK